MEEHDKKALIAHVEETRKTFALLAALGERELAEIVKIIPRPGWTTPAEFTFALGIAESMSAQAKALAGLTRAFAAGGRTVGT